MPNVCTTTPNGTSANVCYYYDQGGAAVYALGRLTKVIDPTGSETTTYFNDGHVKQVTKVTNGQTYNTAYQYNSGGAVTQITYPSGRVVYQSYNAVGQLCQISPSSSGCSGSGYYAGNFSYSSPGNLTGFAYGNGVQATFGYSAARSQLSSLKYTFGTQTYFNLGYWYSKDSTNCPNGVTGNNGSIQCITDSVDGGRTVNYAYDPLGRLSTAKTNGSTAFPQWGMAESYDRFGNRWSQTATAGTVPQPSLTFGTNGVNSSTTNRPNGYNYDSSGNMTAEPPTNNMTYDGENRMTAFSGNGGSASYTYDGNGLRVVKSGGGTTTVTIFAGSSVIAEYDNGVAPTSPSREYIYNPAGGSTTGLLAMISGGAATYYHQDALSVRLTTNASGAIVTQDGTFPFGESWYQLGAANKWFFTSYQRDSESGLDYALARYYDSRTGTFLMTDPIAGKPGDPQSWNRYAYVHNNPIMVTDPSGKFAFLPLLIMFASSFGENMAVDFVSNAIEGHPGISMEDVEGAALGAALGAGEGYLNSQRFMPKGYLSRAPIHFAEESFNSFAENYALTGHASVDWKSVAIGTGLDVLDDYLTYKMKKAKAGSCAASIISRIDQEFGTQAQEEGDPWYSSTGAPYDTGTMNLNISIPADQPGLPASAGGAYFGGAFSPLHIPTGPGGNGGLDNSNTLAFTPHRFTAHIDSGNPHTVIGAGWHFVGDMTGWGGYRPCR